MRIHPNDHLIREARRLAEERLYRRQLLRSQSEISDHLSYLYEELMEIKTQVKELHNAIASLGFIR